jgi:hypothetical protein
MAALVLVRTRKVVSVINLVLSSEIDGEWNSQRPESSLPFVRRLLILILLLLGCCLLPILNHPSRTGALFDDAKGWHGRSVCSGNAVIGCWRMLRENTSSQC